MGIKFKTYSLKDGEDTFVLLEKAYRSFYKNCAESKAIIDARAKSKKDAFYKKIKEDINEYLKTESYSESRWWEFFHGEDEKRNFEEKRVEHIFTLIAFYQDHIFIKYDESNKAIVRKLKSQEKNPPNGLRKVVNILNVLYYIFIIIFTSYFAYTLFQHVINQESNAKALSTPKENIKSIFPPNKSEDSLYLLITRFEEFKRDTINENNCIGLSISNRIDQIVHFKKLPIKFSYEEDIVPPREIQNAKEIRETHNADILIWGFSTNFKEDCGAGDVCFMSSPSKDMMNIANEGFVSPEKVNIEYKPFNSIEMQEKGEELHINGQVFESWLSNMVFLKTQKKKPEFFIINQNLSDEEKSKEFVMRARLFNNIRLTDREIKDLDSALILFPKNEKALLNRAKFYQHSRKYLKSLNDYNLAIKLDPYNPDLHEERALNYFILGNNTSALNDYTKAILLDSLNPDRYIVRARFYEKNDAKRLDLAEKDYTKAIQLDSLNSDTYIKRAYNSWVRKNYKFAESDYTKAILLDSLNPDRHIVRARFYEKNNVKKLDLAEKDYTKAILLDSRNPKRYLVRAKFYEKNNVKKLDLAEKDYTKIILMDPLNPKEYDRRASFYLSNLKRYDLAEKDYTKAIKLNPENSRYYYRRSHLYNQHLHKYNLAVRDITKAINLDSSDIAPYSKSGYHKLLDRAELYLKLGDYKLAEKDFSTVKSLISTSKNSFFSKKLRLVKDVIELNKGKNSTNIDALLFKAKESQTKKKFKLAEKYFDKVLAIDSTNRKALRDRVLVIFKQKKYDLAKQECQILLKKGAVNHTTFTILGNILMKEGNYEEAIEQFSEAIFLIDLKNSLSSKGTNPASAYNQRGLCLDKLGQHKKAELDYKKAVSLNPKSFKFKFNLIRSYLIYQYWYFTLLFFLILIGVFILKRSKSLKKRHFSANK